MGQAGGDWPPAARGVPLWAAASVVAAVVTCSLYANLSYLVTDPADYRLFPPFRPYVDANMNDHLGHEYFYIARSLVAGEGFSHPFSDRTGPTAWVPPLLPSLQAGLLWACGGDRFGPLRLGHRATQVCLVVPLVFDPAHEQGTVELDRALGEVRFVLEEAGPHLLDLQRLHAPVQTAQLQALEARRVRGRRVAQRARLEERGGFLQ